MHGCPQELADYDAIIILRYAPARFGNMNECVPSGQTGGLCVRRARRKLGVFSSTGTGTAAERIADTVTLAHHGMVIVDDYAAHRNC